MGGCSRRMVARKNDQERENPRTGLGFITNELRIREARCSNLTLAPKGGGVKLSRV